MKSITQALHQYRDVFKLLSLFETEAELSDEHSHKIVLAIRDGSVDENKFGHDKVRISWKTAHVFKRVMEMFTSLEVEKAKELYNALRSVGPYGATFAGLLFEGYALRCILQGNSDQTVRSICQDDKGGEQGGLPN